MAKGTQLRIDGKTYQILKKLKETRGIAMVYAIAQAVEKMWGFVNQDKKGRKA